MNAISVPHRHKRFGRRLRVSLEDPEAARKLRSVAIELVESPSEDGPRPDFDGFYRREYQRIVGLVYALSGGRYSAEDIAQEAFLAAHRNWNKIVTLEQPAAWVRRVATNMAVSAVRRRVSEARALLRLGSRREPLAELPEGDGAFWAAVRALPKRQAQAIALHYLEDLPTAEIASILECSESTVRVHLHNGRKALSERLREDLHEEETR
ncbi:MAG: RNA polymerase sigma factor [Actinomycetota bacterium]